MTAVKVFSRQPWSWTALAWMYFILCLAMIASPVISQSFSWDDLHLFRNYSLVELRSVLIGPWDPDGIETPGYRPVTTFFFHLLYHMFRENPLFYRLFSVFLFSVALVMITLTARRYSIPWRTALLACTIYLSSDTMVIYLGWITESYRALHLLLFAFYIFLLDRAIERRSHLYAGGSVLLFCCALLLREENLPLLFAVLAVLAYREHTGEQKRWALLGMSGLFLTVTAGYAWTRHLFVGQQVQESLTWSGPLSLFGRMTGAFPMLGVPLLGVLGAALIVSRWPDKQRILVFLALCAVSCLPGLGNARPDVALFPALFFALATAVSIEALREKWGVRNAVAPVAVGVIFFLGLSGNWRRAEDMQDLSINNIARTCQYLYGEHREKATIPPARRLVFDARYKGLGLHHPAQFSVWIEDLRQDAKSAGRFHADGSGLPFLAMQDFLKEDTIRRGTRRLLDRIQGRLKQPES